jgi:hypothetical protein
MSQFIDFKNTVTENDIIIFINRTMTQYNQVNMYNNLIECLDYILYVKRVYNSDILNSEKVLLYIMQLRDLSNNIRSSEFKSEQKACSMAYNLFIELHQNKFEKIMRFYENKKIISITTIHGFTQASVHLKDEQKREAKFTVTLSKPAEISRTLNRVYIGASNYNEVYFDINMLPRQTETYYSFENIYNNPFDKLYEAFTISPQKAQEVYIQLFES